MKSILFSGLIITLLTVVALMDFYSPSHLIVSILFILPLALCGLQSSRRILVGTATASVVLTIAAGLWGIEGAVPTGAWDEPINRCLLIVSVLTFTTFLYVGMINVQKRAHDAREMDSQSASLEAQNEQLEILVAAADREVQAHKSAQDHANASEAKFRGILESAPDGMIISDLNGVIAIVNAETERLFGYGREELIGQTLEFLIPKRFRDSHPGHRLGYTARPRTRSMGEGLELAGLRKDGTEFPVEISLSPLVTPDGTLISSAIRDVSSRKAAQEKLQLQEETHRMAVEVAEMGTWMWKIDRDEITWSDKFGGLFGFSSDAVLTFDAVNQHIHPEDRLRLGEAVKATLEEGAPFDLEYRVIWPDSSIHWIASKGRVHRTAEGRASDMQGIIVDITERKEAQEVLQQRAKQERRAQDLMRSNEELQQFAYVAAHDLQEPLRMVASYTQLIGQRYKGRLDADADEFIGFAVDGAHRMQLLIADLLAYCRVGTAGRDLREISSLETLEQALRNLQGTLEESGGVVTHDALPIVMADRSQLVQLFQNIVGNALKYRTEQRPRVHISAQKTSANEWVFSMRDNGIGIDPQYFDKIFVMFQRLHRREEFSGTGIGLTLCKKIAERHGGRIWVEANAGPGSTFYVAFPERDASWGNAPMPSSAPAFNAPNRE